MRDRCSIYQSIDIEGFLLALGSGDEMGLKRLSWYMVLFGGVVEH